MKKIIKKVISHLKKDKKSWEKLAKESNKEAQDDDTLIKEVKKKKKCKAKKAEK